MGQPVAALADDRDPVQAADYVAEQGTDVVLGGAARSAILKVMRAVPEPFRPAAAATSQRILVDPARWMRSPDPVGQLGVLQAAVFTGRRLFRVSRVADAVTDEAPVRRRDGVELADLWGLLRQQVEERPAGVPVVVRVRRERLDMFRRICAANLAEDAGDGEDAEWVVMGLRFAAVAAARTLLSFGPDVEVVSPPEVQADLATVVTAVVAQYA